MKLTLLIGLLTCVVCQISGNKTEVSIQIKNGANCDCVVPERCGDGGDAIKPRNDTDSARKIHCPNGMRYCFVIIPKLPEPSPHSCGVNDPSELPGFLYGKDDVANVNEFPWLVKILGKDGEYLGSGALIDEKRVLTVYHILDKADFYPTSVVLGLRHHLPLHTYIRRHDDYNFVNLRNDIAILYLKVTLDFKALYPEVVPICLPSKLEDWKGCELSTFGENSLPIVRKVKMPLLPDQYCEDRLRHTDLGPGFILDRNSFVCAGGMKPREDACGGHGGSPLVCNVNGFYQLAGLVSWGLTDKDCSDSGKYPGVYVNVKNYVNWINDPRNK